MRIDLGQWTAIDGWRFDAPGSGVHPAQLVLYFASPAVVAERSWWNGLRSRYPLAKLVGCSTGGEIYGSDVRDGTVSAVGIGFDRSTVQVGWVEIRDFVNSYEAGLSLGSKFPHNELRGIFVLSDGTKVNGSELVRGLKSVLPGDVALTGGLAGDGAAFHSTRVGADRLPAAGIITAVGFYGNALEIRHGSFGGWDPFGPARRITRSDRNILYELDGEPALDLYKRYLGAEAANLPGSALLFPLQVRVSGDEAVDVVRTVVAIDEDHRAMIFAGDVREGSIAQLMRGSFEHLIEGAAMAARHARGEGKGELAILVSCIGRKLLMGQRIAEEVEAVVDVLGRNCAAIGFYSYGEICPHEFSDTCRMHNQTMTITVLRENGIA